MFSSLLSRLFATIVVSLFALVLGYGIYTTLAFGNLTDRASASLDQLTTNTLEQQLARQVDDSARVIETAYRGLTLNVQLVYSSLAFLMPSDSLDIGSDKVEAFGKTLPTIRFKNQVMNENYALVDDFTLMTGGSVATLFVRNGDDFVRISTSLKKEDGTRAVGTSLDVKHPAYDKVLRGETYTGLATLFGKKYMTHYQPIMRDGKSVAIAFVGYDATKAFESLSNQLKSVKVGKTGYLFALDGKGTLVLHPTREGKNIADKKDVNGFAYIQEQLANAKVGEAKLIRYTIPDKEGDTPREKVAAAYTLLPGLGWILSSSAYPEEFTSAFDQAKSVLISDLSHVQHYALALLVVVGLLMLGVIFVVLRQSLHSLMQLAVTMKRIVSSGDLSQRAPTDSVTEVKLVAIEFNQLIEQMDKVVGETETVLSALGDGAFDKRVAQSYPGKLGDLAQAVNGAIQQVTATVINIDHVMKSFADGQFGTKVNEDSAKGAFKQILTQAKVASGFLSTTINDINAVMHHMNEGDFNARVQADARGDLQQLKATINTSMDRLAMAMNGITHIVMAQAEGDLTKECTADFHGQLKDLQSAINASAAKLKEVIAVSMQVSHVVSDAAEQVSYGSRDISGRVQEQAASLEETSATMNQMSAAVQANTANARKVAELTNHVQGQAKDGVQVMQQTISAMQSIKESSSKISDIVSIIDSIAFQTNLLALNAAVEAARAGEHGRGFAVVASEVRTLAGKSADAAKDIKALINDSVSRIENGTQLADKSGEMLHGIAGSIVQVAGMIEQIANASNEQSVGIGQVHLAIADIDKVTQENAALVEETTASAESLSTEANNLRNNMAFFKTGQQQNYRSNAAPSRSPARVQSAPTKKPAALPSPKKSNSEDWGEF